MKKLTFFAVIAILSSCSKSDDLNPNPESGVITNKTVFNQFLTERTGNTDHYFELKDIKRVGEQLEIVINGQCQASYYQVIWDGSVLFSAPPQINLMMGFEIPAGVVCDLVMKEHTLRVNLKELLGKKYDDAEYIIHALNGSKVQDKTSHPDGNVTDKEG